QVLFLYLEFLPVFNEFALHGIRKRHMRKSCKEDRLLEGYPCNDFGERRLPLDVFDGIVKHLRALTTGFQQVLTPLVGLVFGVARGVVQQFEGILKSTLPEVKVT